MAIIKNIINLKKDSPLVTNLRELIRKHNITEAELSRKTSIPQPTLHKVLTGKTGDPRISTLQVLANFFNLSLDQLLNGNSAQLSNNNGQTQSVPIISWCNCVNKEQYIPTLNSDNYDKWVIIEYINDNIFALESKAGTKTQFPQKTILIIDPITNIQDGDLIIVLYPNTTEATLREVYLDGPIKRLIPLNPELNCEDMNDDIKIIGVVVQSKYVHNR